MRMSEHAASSREPHTYQDFLAEYSAQAHEILGRLVVRYGLTHTRTQHVFDVCTAFNFLEVVLLNPARRESFGSMTLRDLQRKFTARLCDLEQQADRRLSGEATADEHVTTLGLLHEARESLGHVERLISWLEEEAH